MKFFGKKTPGTKGTGRIGAALDIAESVHGSSDGGEKNQKSEAPTVSEESKQTAGAIKVTSKSSGGLLSKLFGSKKTDDALAEPMSNVEYLGEIYKLLVKNQEDIKFERQESVEKKRTDDNDEENRHKEIIKALTLRRRPTKTTRRAKKEEKPEDKKKEPGKEPGKEPDKDKVRKESEAKAKKEAEEKAAREKAARDKADKEKADKEKANKERELQEKANKEKADKERELQEKTKRDQLEKERADKERELQEKTKRDQLEKERADAKTAKEEADRKAKEAATQAEKETAKREQEEARKKLEEAEKAKQKAAQEAAEREKQRAADEANKKAAEEAKRKAEEEAKRKAEEEAKRKAEEKLKKEAEEKAKKEAEEKLKKEAEEKAKKEAEEKAKKEAEEKLKKETAEKLKKEEQEKLKKEAEEKDRLEKLKEKKPEPPTASQQPPKPAPKPDVGTATQVITGAVAVSAALAGRQALATNISEHESGNKGYNAYNRGDFFLAQKKTEGAYLQKNNIDFSKMSISDYLKRTNKKLKAGGKLDASDPNVLFAVGKYQIVPGTMLGLVKALKLDPDKTFLTPDTQDMLFAKGLTKSSRPIVDAYINGKEGVTRDSAILALAQEFASVGVPYDIKAKTMFFNKETKEYTLPHVNLKKGESFWKKDGGFNNAKNLPDAVGAALDADRLYTKVNAKPKNIPSSNSGTQVDQGSTTNKDLKGDLNKSNNKDSNSSGGFFGNLFGGGSDTAPTVKDAPIHTRGNK